MKIDTFIKECEIELNNIFQFWYTKGRNQETGQFYGAIDHYGQVDDMANKGIIMYTRQLWAFSSAALFYNSAQYEKVADSCYQFLQKHFYDQEHDGYIWETDTLGNGIEFKKLTYAQAFALYSLTEYYLLKKTPEIFDKAHAQFECIMKHCFDTENGGFLEGFSRDWQFDKNNRLSDKDSYAAKSMNTNLHILEAFTSFYKVFRTESAKNALKRVVLDFSQYIIGADKHLILFLDNKWTPESSIYSYGHDIETTWLLWEAVEILEDEVLKDHIKVLILAMVDVFCTEGIDEMSAVINEKDLKTGHVDRDRYWWPQCEALEGLANAYAITGNVLYFNKLLSVWEFVKNNVIDKLNGEWYNRLNENNTPVVSELKGGMWKTPYHNGRALMRLISRFSSELQKQT